MDRRLGFYLELAFLLLYCSWQVFLKPILLQLPSNIL